MTEPTVSPDATFDVALSTSGVMFPEQEVADDLSVETASALATRALCADLEHWATETADLDGRIGVLDLIRVLDVFRAAAPLDVP